jgi:hypothetical protein
MLAATTVTSLISSMLSPQNTWGQFPDVGPQVEVHWTPENPEEFPGKKEVDGK